MRVYIGPYLSHVSLYDFADKIVYLGFSQDTADRFGDWLVESWIGRVSNWIQNKRKRKIKVQIDNYDTWGMYNTLSVIIAPMLRQLKETKHGFPLVDNKDVPPELRTKGKKEGEAYENASIAKWDYVLNEMIFAFETYEKMEYGGEDWEERFYSGQIDLKTVETEIAGEKMYTVERGPNHTFKVDTEAMKAHADRIKNGFELFGKYYLNLWD